MVRHKNRYMVIELHPVDHKELVPLSIKTYSIQHTIISVVQRLHGDFGAAAIISGFVVKYCNEQTKIAVVRCRHGPHKIVTSILPLIKFIENKRININTLYMGATIKQCFKFILKYQQKKYDEFCVNLKTDEEKAALKKAIMNITPILNTT